MSGELPLLVCSGRHLIGVIRAVVRWLTHTSDMSDHFSNDSPDREPSCRVPEFGARHSLEVRNTRLASCVWEA